MSHSKITALLETRIWLVGLDLEEVANKAEETSLKERKSNLENLLKRHKARA